jgi:2-haloacid dehalogenase
VVGRSSVSEGLQTPGIGSAGRGRPGPALVYPVAVDQPPQTQFDTVVFDIGNVLLKWDPARAFIGVLEPAHVKTFMDEIDFASWNHAQDTGRTLAEGVAVVGERWPQHVEAVRAYGRNFTQTIVGEIPGSTRIVEELRVSNIRLLALTNWSAETFPWARDSFGVLDQFEGIVVSGLEGVAKPDPAIFRLLIERYGIDPERVVFIDDSPVNVSAAARVGMTGLVFTGPADLRRGLRALGLLSGPGG